MHGGFFRFPYAFPRVKFAPGRIIAVVTCFLWSWPTLAQAPASGSIGIGLTNCATFADTVQAEGARDRYFNWLMGWFSGFNVGSTDAGLGTIDLEGITEWFFDAQTYCRAQPATLFADAVREVAIRVVLTRSPAANTSAVGFGLARCADALQGEWDSAYAQWAFGFLSGYNTVREDVGIPLLSITDEEVVWSALRSRCAAEPRAYLNGTVARWLLEEEDRRNDTGIPTGSRPTSLGLTNEATARSAASAAEPVSPASVAGIGADYCSDLLLYVAADEPMFRALKETEAVSWMQGYLTASDMVRTARGQQRIDWRSLATSVSMEQLWQRVRSACQADSSVTYISVVKAMEADLLESYSGGALPGGTSLGAGSDRCDSLEPQSTSLDDPEQFIASSYEYVFAHAGLRGWMAGFFSSFNEALTADDSRPPLNVTRIEDDARSVHGICKANPSLRIHEAILMFLNDAYPAQPEDPPSR